MRRFVPCEQRTAEWLSTRAGLITGSRISDVLAFKKRAKAGEKPEEMQSRADYRMELVAGRLTGLSPSKFVNAAMQWGIDHEDEARSLYEIEYECVVELVGFAIHPELDYSGASPDGLVGNSVLEIKCPETTTHLRWMLEGGVPDQHKPQMTWEMVCCEATMSYFVSYDPRLPIGLQMFVREYALDVQYAETITNAVIAFNNEIDNVIQKLMVAADGAA